MMDLKNHTERLYTVALSFSRTHTVLFLLKVYFAVDSCKLVHQICLSEEEKMDALPLENISVLTFLFILY